jgi:hypothetical protein
MALLQRAAVNDSRNLPASRDCFGVSQRRRVAVPYIAGDVCLPISGVKHDNKTMQSRDRSSLFVLIVLLGREPHRFFVTPVASPEFFDICRLRSADHFLSSAKTGSSSRGLQQTR